MKKQIPMFEDLSLESCTLLYDLISSLLSFRRVNIRHLELNIPQMCDVFLIFREWELRVCIFTIRKLERALFVMFSIALQVLFMCVQSFWCHLLKKRIAFIWRENVLGYLSADIICSEKRTVFGERTSRKTVSFVLIDQSRASENI